MDMERILITILKLFIAFVFCETSSVSTTNLSPTVAVLYNDAKLPRHLNSTLLRNSFERIPSLLSKTSKPSVRFVYFDLNSSICNYGKFLSLFTNGTRQFSLVVLIESCSCEKKLSAFVHLLDVKFISSCDEPMLTVAGSSAVLLRHTKRNRRHFLVVPQNAHGLEFYNRLSSRLFLEKIEIDRTFWLSKKEDLSDAAELKTVFHGINHNVTHETTNGASFIIALKEIDHVLVEMILNIARMELNETFEKILWIFPQIHSHFEISSLFLMKENAQVLTFKDISTAISSLDVCSDQAVHAILTKTIDFMRRCWNMDKERYSELPKVGVTEVCSLNNAGLDIYKRNFIDVLQLQKHDLFEEIYWKRVSTWNGQTLQPCCNGILSQASSKAIRIPLVEYRPFVVKHKFDGHLGKCPYDMRVCYGLKRQAINNQMVINHDARFCCSGLTIDVIIYLDNHMFTTKPYVFELYFQEEQVYGVYDEANHAWNGVFSDVLSGKADVAIDLYLSPQRCLALDCSLGYLFTGFNTIAKVSNMNIEKKDSFPSLVGNFELFLSPFDYRLFITVLMFFNFFLFLIWGADKICLYYRNKRTGRKDKFTLLESTSYVWAIAFSRDVGDSKKPMTLTARYLSSWLSFLAVIFTNVYVARLMVELVKEQPVPTFRSLKDSKVLDNEFQIGVVTGSAMEAFFHNSRDPVLKQVYENNVKKHLIPTMDAGVQAVKNGTLRGFIADTISLLSVVRYDQSCSLTLIDKEFSALPIGFVFRKDWPWVKEFKTAELEMNERNMSRKVLHRHFSGGFQCVSADVHQTGLTIADISGLFMILVFGIAYCVFSLVLENVFSSLSYWYQNYSKNWDVSHVDGVAPKGDVLETNDSSIG